MGRDGSVSVPRPARPCPTDRKSNMRLDASSPSRGDPVCDRRPRHRAPGWRGRTRTACRSSSAPRTCRARPGGSPISTRPRRASARSTIPTGRGPLRARLYEPSRPRRRAALLVPGLHPAGIDEPRLVAAGPAARRQRPRDRHARHPGALALRDHAGDHRRDRAGGGCGWRRDAGACAAIGKVGADRHQLQRRPVGRRRRPAVAGRTASRSCFSFGGHADLPRVLRYLCTGVEPRPGGQLRLPSSSAGGAPDQPFVRRAARLRRRGHAARASPIGSCRRRRSSRCAPRCDASCGRRTSNAVDKPQAERDVRGAARGRARRMPEPSATLLRYVNDRDVVHLGARLLPLRRRRTAAIRRCRRRRSPKPTAPVFLLHGIDDNVIPAVESEYLADELRGRAPVRLLLSGLISHAEADRPIARRRRDEAGGLLGRSAVALNIATSRHGGRGGRDRLRTDDCS